MQVLNIQKRILQIFDFCKPKSPPQIFCPPFCSPSPPPTYKGDRGGQFPYEDIVFGKPCQGTNSSLARTNFLSPTSEKNSAVLGHASLSNGLMSNLQKYLTPCNEARQESLWP